MTRQMRSFWQPLVVEVNFSRGRKARTKAKLRQQSLDRAFRPRLKEYGQRRSNLLYEQTARERAG